MERNGKEWKGREWKGREGNGMEENLPLTREPEFSKHRLILKKHKICKNINEVDILYEFEKQKLYWPKTNGRTKETNRLTTYMYLLYVQRTCEENTNYSFVSDRKVIKLKDNMYTACENHFHVM